MNETFHLAIAQYGRRIISSMRSPDYRLFFLMSVSQSAALTVQTMVSPLLMYRLTGSSALLGVNSLMSAIPSILIGTFGGALADRLKKKHILTACFVLAIMIANTIGVLVKTGVLSREAEGSWMILMGISFIQGCLMGFMMPSMMSILPETVKREQLTNAIALNNLQMSILAFIIPSLAGILIDQFGFEATYFSIAGFYVVAMIFILCLPSRSTVTLPGQPILANISDGFRYILGNKTILYLLLVTLAMVLLSGPHQFLLPLFTDGIFNAGATGLGLLVSLSGAGGLAGSLTMAFLPNRKRGLLLLLGGILSGVSLSIFAFSSDWGLSLLIMVFVGLASAIRVNLANALLQTYTDAAYMGRVMSLTFVQFGMMSVCTFLAGLAAERLEVQWVIGSMAMALILIMIGILTINKSIRKLQ